MVLFYVAIESDSVSFVRFPFISYVQVIWCVISPLKVSMQLFFFPFLFPICLFFCFTIILSFLLLNAVINFSLLFLVYSFSLWIDVSTLFSVAERPLPSLFIESYCLSIVSHCVKRHVHSHQFSLSFGRFVWVHPLFFLRMVQSILQRRLSRFLFLWWYFCCKAWFWEVFMFLWGTLFLVLCCCFFVFFISVCLIDSIEQTEMKMLIPVWWNLWFGWIIIIIIIIVIIIINICVRWVFTWNQFTTISP